MVIGPACQGHAGDRPADASKRPPSAERHIKWEGSVLTKVNQRGRSTTGHAWGIVSLLALLLAAVVPSAAAAPAREGTARSSTSLAVPVVAAAEPTAANGEQTASACAVTAYGYTGYAICDFLASNLDWGGGNVEYFVVGTDYAIWHAWKGSGGWHSLGGQAAHATPNGAYAYPYGVSTYGTDGRLWCRDHPWTTGWRLC
jgi:hypothetical protein